MKGGKLEVFLDYMKRGEELVFIYKGQKFFLEGWWDHEKSEGQLLLDRWEPPSDGYVWEGKPCKDPKTFFDIIEFCNAEVFDGKCFWEIEPEIEWVDD